MCVWTSVPEPAPAGGPGWERDVRIAPLVQGMDHPDAWLGRKIVVLVFCKQVAQWWVALELSQGGVERGVRLRNWDRFCGSVAV